MKVQRAFVAAGEARKEVYRYITITIKNVDEHQAGDYIDAVCSRLSIKHFVVLIMMKRPRAILIQLHSIR